MADCVMGEDPLRWGWHCQVHDTPEDCHEDGGHDDEPNRSCDLCTGA